MSAWEDDNSGLLVFGLLLHWVDSEIVSCLLVYLHDYDEYYDSNQSLLLLQSQLPINDSRELAGSRVDQEAGESSSSISIIIIVVIVIVVIMAYQHIPTSNIPTRWEYVILMKGGNMTQSHSHHV